MSDAGVKTSLENSKLSLEPQIHCNKLFLNYNL